MLYIRNTKIILFMISSLLIFIAVLIVLLYGFMNSSTKNLSSYIENLDKKIENHDLSNYNNMIALSCIGTNDISLNFLLTTNRVNKLCTEEGKYFENNISKQQFITDIKEKTNDLVKRTYKCVYDDNSKLKQIRDLAQNKTISTEYYLIYKDSGQLDKIEAIDPKTKSIKDVYETNYNTNKQISKLTKQPQTKESFFREYEFIYDDNSKLKQIQAFDKNRNLCTEYKLIYKNSGELEKIDLLHSPSPSKKSKNITYFTS